jgi:hypothetical protein
MFWSGLILGLLIGGAIGAVVMGVVASGSAGERGAVQTNQHSYDKGWAEGYAVGVDATNAQHREKRRQAGYKASETRRAKVSA